MSVAADGPDGQPRLAAFLKRLQELGWTDGQNVRNDVRWGAGEAERTREYVAELVAIGPDVILASGDHPVVALQQATSTVPIIFAMVADPVGAGFVESLAHPGRNTTGFTLYEYSTTAKWPELLKEIAPGVKRESARGLLSLAMPASWTVGESQPIGRMHRRWRPGSRRQKSNRT
jgi:putative ABC transport system substrate-binding protein